ncbi:hypothetical protein, partial [Klebsiella pneumoniae]|uniref:hypothetical protein n=1 Tax=Klebsiella pneumoniae TaxID=573 RepID=UPI001955D576
QCNIKNTTNKQSYIQGTSPEYKSTDKQPKKTTRINKPLQLHTLNSKQFRKLKDFIGKNSH